MIKNSILKISSYIAKSITQYTSNSFSNFIIKLSTIATIISVAVMVIALAIVQGFKDTVKDKTFEYWGHFHITSPKMSQDLSYNDAGIRISDAYINQIKNADQHITDIQPYVLGAGLLATNEDNQGIQIKGVTEAYFKNQTVTKYTNCITYPTDNYSTDLILSEKVLSLINKKIGDSLLLYILDNNDISPRVRKMKIAGTYHLGIEEIDNNFILCDIRLLQSLFQWDSNKVSGLQIKVDNIKYADAAAENTYFNLYQEEQSILYITDIYSEIFQWLELQDINAQIILLIMTIVAVINMITAMITFILERLNMIGILKTLGMNNWNIRKIFIYHFQMIVFKGIVGGLILGLSLCFIQAKFNFISIDESIYYMSHIPIKVQWWHLISISLGTLLVSFLILMATSIIIKKIKIVDAIKFK
jgi:lipoprotein-releasing system permease protein